MILIKDLYIFISYIISYFFSYTCFKCGIDVQTIGFCPKCFNKLKILGMYICPSCGRDNEIYCCEKSKYKNVIFRHGLEINNYLKDILIKFKYNDMQIIGAVLTNLLFKYCKDNTYDFIIPVPMFEIKKVYRLYSAPDTIAYTLAQHLRIPVYHDILVKNKLTTSQTSLNYKQRQQNIKNSFSIGNSKLLMNKNIILVDDLMTTGATLSECIVTLLKYKPRSILVVTLSYSD